MAFNNTGAWAALSGAFPTGGPVNDTSFGYSGSTSDAYPSSGAAGDMVFGFQCGTLVISNTGANALAFAFPALYNNGRSGDSGIVPAGQTIVLQPMINKGGMRIRSLNTGASTTFTVCAI